MMSFPTDFPVNCLPVLPDFERMCALYREWNGKINVISRKDIDNVFSHHILHSLCIAAFLFTERPQEWADWKKGGVKVLDVGCGGGFPGIPLAACFPDVEFTLCDSIGKKIRVCSAVAEGMGLENVRAVQCRAEELPGRWDYAVSRAVTSLDAFYPWVAGRFDRSILYLKGGDVTGEMEALRRSFPSRALSAQLWGLSSVVPDEYFSEKLVVCLENCEK